MRLPLLLAVLVPALAAAGCSGVEYRDTNAAVDANPLCASRADRPGEPVAAECERERAATWTSNPKTQDQPLDFSGSRGND